MKNILRTSAFHIHNLSFEKEAMTIKNKESEFAYYQILLIFIILYQSFQGNMQFYFVKYFIL